jgi:DNA-binding CsgD family transcriptional regulator
MGAAHKIQGYNDLVGLVYDGVEEATPWKSLMCQLSEHTDAHDASMVIAARNIPGSFLLVTDNEDPVATHPERVNDVMSVNMLMDMPTPRAMNIDEMMPEGEFLRSALYLQFLKPLNIRHLLGRDVVRSEALCVKLTLERTVEQGPFGGAEKELVELLAPHIQRAIRLREQQTHGSYMQYFFEDAMAKLSIGCLMLDRGGRLVSMNACARRLLEHTDVLCVRNGLLRTVGGVDGKELGKAIDLALAAHRNGCRSQNGVALQLQTAPGNGVLDLVVKPLIADRLLDANEKPAVVVYLNDSRKAGIDLDPAALVTMYGFTNCESRLSALLARGTSLGDAAATLGVSINTVKTHLRGIYEKLGTNKQSQVVAQLNHSTARLL